MAQTFEYIEKKKGNSELVIEYFETKIVHEVKDLDHAFSRAEKFVKTQGENDRLTYGLTKFQERHGYLKRND